MQSDGGWTWSSREGPEKLGTGQASLSLLVMPGLSVWLVSLGFLTAWQPQDSQIAYVVADSFRS